MQDRAISPKPAIDLAGRIAERWPPAAWRDLEVAVAVSGGADSVALARALATLKAETGGRGSLTLLHLDHGARGAASAEDACWVQAFADGLGLACRVGRAENLDSESEESLREARRAFYRSSADALGARYLATGHTADDQAETVLFRLLRGSGIRGLRGIPRFSQLTEGCTLVRPLLEVTREELAAYLEALSQAHREDETNRDPSYTRNWLRGHALPLLRERFHRADLQLVRLSHQAEEIGEIIDHAANRVFEACLLSPVTGGLVRLDRHQLQREPAALVRETVRLAWRRAGWPEQAMDRACWHRLSALVEAGGRGSFPGGVTASVSDDELVLATEPPPIPSDGSC